MLKTILSDLHLAKPYNSTEKLLNCTISIIYASINPMFSAVCTIYHIILK